MKTSKIIFALLVFVLIVFLLHPVDTRYTYAHDVDTISRSHDMYVLIPTRTVGAKAPWLWACLWPPKNDFIVIHLHNKSVQRLDIPGARNASPCIYRGDLYLACSDEYRNGFIVPFGAAATRLTDAQSASIHDYMSRHIDWGLDDHGDWVGQDFYGPNLRDRSLTQEKSKSFSLGQDKYTLTFHYFPVGPKQGYSYAVQGPGLQQPEQTLYRWSLPPQHRLWQ